MSCCGRAASIPICFTRAPPRTLACRARSITRTVTLEAFVDLFNLLNSQATTQEDDNYTFSWAGPIQNGTAKDT